MYLLDILFGAVIAILVIPGVFSLFADAGDVFSGLL